MSTNLFVDRAPLRHRSASVDIRGVVDRIHLLRPESITPIATYLDLRAASAASAGAHIDFCSVLLYREREYLAMFSSRWMIWLCLLLCTNSIGSSRLTMFSRRVELR